jgi:hypothetical protein
MDHNSRRKTGSTLWCQYFSCDAPMPKSLHYISDTFERLYSLAYFGRYYSAVRYWLLTVDDLNQFQSCLDRICGEIEWVWNKFMSGACVLLQPVYWRAMVGLLGFDSRQDKKVFLLRSVQTGSSAYPVSYPTGTGALFPGIKRSERKNDHLPVPAA